MNLLFKLRADFQFWNSNVMLITWNRYHAENTIIYPSIDKVLEYADKQDSVESQEEKPKPSKTYIEHIKWVSSNYTCILTNWRNRAKIKCYVTHF